jgi:hypothetical protein
VRFRAAVFACGLMLWLPTAAAAQSPAAGAVTFVYGISTGVGQRRATGTFTVSEEPAGAGQPPSPRTTASLELDGGIRPAPRLAVMAIYEGGATFGNSQGWGSLAAHAVVRGWVTTGVWIEGGWGLAELAFRPSSVPGNAPIRWWAPSGEAAIGFDIFQGPTVSLNLFVRYAEARFDAVRQQTVSVQIGLLGRY